MKPRVPSALPALTRKRTLVTAFFIVALGVGICVLVNHLVRQSMREDAHSAFTSQFITDLAKFDLFFLDTKLALRSVADSISATTNSLPSAAVYQRVCISNTCVLQCDRCAASWGAKVASAAPRWPLQGVFLWTTRSCSVVRFAGSSWPFRPPPA
jgi:hypothetical protein